MLDEGWTFLAYHLFPICIVLGSVPKRAEGLSHFPVTIFSLGFSTFVLDAICSFTISYPNMFPIQLPLLEKRSTIYCMTKSVNSNGFSQHLSIWTLSLSSLFSLLFINSQSTFKYTPFLWQVLIYYHVLWHYPFILEVNDKTLINLNSSRRKRP